MNATAKDLRFHSRALLEAVSRGEEVVITFHGKPMARMVPMKQDKPRLAAGKYVAFGMWANRPEMADVKAYVRRLRKGRM
jgi:prevent-host-death family protein